MAPISDAENPFSNIRIWMVLVLFCYALVASELFVNVLMDMEKGPWRSMAINLCWRSLLMLCLLGIARHQGVDLRRLVGPTPSRTQFLTSLWMLLPLVTLFFVGAWALYQASSLVPTLPLWPSGSGKEDGPFDQPPRLVQLGQIISDVGYVPIFEEFVFRGIMLNRLAVRFGARKGLIASSLIFGAFHLDNRMPAAACAGLFFGLLYLQTQSLPLCVALHMCVNGVGTMLRAAGFATIPLQAAPILGMIAVPWFFLYVKRHWPASTCAAPYFAHAKSG
ncbi:MAG: CPBP family intramembrane metalloprotease [Verrucomicrobia bacterium]|nr:CPBP family intramembrane metalloprotease [Verrucomicrobiota bacterium]